MRVLRLQADGVAVCAADGNGPSEVLVELVGAVEPGDLLLVHAGTALARLGVHA
jgi:hydrogenase maturation factor